MISFDEHLCTGAECPHCSPFPAGSVTFETERDSAKTQTVTLINRKRKDFSRFRDSLGNIPTSYPKVLLPSITAIILDPACAGAYWRVLVHQRKDNQHWGFLGGGQHLGESILETVHREVREESGIAVTIDRLVCVDSDPTQGSLCSYPDGNVAHYMNCSFLCTWVGGNPSPSQESLQVRWHTTKTLPEPFLAPHRWRLRQAMSGMGEVAVR